jgi:hypothetical protein
LESRNLKLVRTFSIVLVLVIAILFLGMLERTVSALDTKGGGNSGIDGCGCGVPAWDPLANPAQAIALMFDWVLYAGFALLISLRRKRQHPYIRTFWPSQIDLLWRTRPRRHS